MTPLRKRRQRRRDSNKPLRRVMAERDADHQAHVAPTGRAPAHPSGCLAMHHQSGIDFDRDCPMCMDELMADPGNLVRNVDAEREARRGQ